jgi:hypothetical protein
MTIKGPLAIAISHPHYYSLMNESAPCSGTGIIMACKNAIPDKFLVSNKKILTNFG